MKIRTYAMADAPDAPQRGVPVLHEKWPWCDCCDRITEVCTDEPPAHYVIDYDTVTGAAFAAPVYRIVIWTRLPKPS